MNRPSFDFSAIVGLAAQLAQDPTAAALLAQHHPKQLEQVLRVAEFPLVRFVPFGQGEPPQHQVAFCAGRARERWAVCGNRAGKTILGLMEDVADCLGINLVTKGPTRRFDPPIEIWVVSETEETSIEIAQRTVAEEILGGDLTSYGWELVRDETHYTPKGGFRNNNLTFTNGSRIDFKYSSAGRGSFQGTKKHKIHLDEAQPKDVYSECLARTIDYGGQMIGTMTPIYDKNHGLPWIFQELYVQRERKKIEFYNWSLFDNPHLSAAAKETLVHSWDEDEMEARAYGMFTPMGVSLAFDRKAMRSWRHGCTAGREGDLQIDNHNRLVWQPARQRAAAV